MLKFAVKKHSGSDGNFLIVYFSPVDNSTGSIRLLNDLINDITFVSIVFSISIK